MTIQEKFDNFAREVRLCTAEGEYPIVVSVSPDPDKENAQIITVQGGGFPLPLPVALDKEIEPLQLRLGGVVYNLSFGEDTTQARFGLLPKKGEPNENL